MLGADALNADAPQIAILDLHPSTASATAQQAGQKIFELACALGGFAGTRFPARLRGIEHVFSDDPKMWRVGALPLFLRVRPADALTRLRVLHHADPVPDDPAGIDFVLQDAVTSGLAADKCRRSPKRSTRRLDLLGVQLQRDRVRRLAGDVVGEDATNDFSFVVDDFQFTGLAHDGPITVRPAAGVTALAHNAGHSAARMQRQIF
nr:hypothetical protein [Bradyrhizobium elkanii]